MPSFVVVGASRGLGYEWLHFLSADKANVVIGTARTPTAVNAKLAADGINGVHVVQADMIDQKSLQAAAAEIAELTDGTVDYLIVNGAYLNPATAGLSPVALANNESLLRDEMKQNLDVNVIGVMFAINAFLLLIRKSSIKKITVLSTGMADFDLVANAGISFTVAYGAIKAALNMVVLKYSIELKSEGIILLLLSPGVVNTRLDPRKCFTVFSKIAFKKNVKSFTDGQSFRGRGCDVPGHGAEISDLISQFQRSYHCCRKRSNAESSHQKDHAGRQWRILVPPRK